MIGKTLANIFNSAGRLCLIFALVGPPVGGVTLWVLKLANILDWGWPIDLPSALGSLAIILFGSYVLGMPSALLAAVLLTICKNVIGRYPGIGYAIAVAVVITVYDVLTVAPFHLLLSTSPYNFILSSRMLDDVEPGQPPSLSLAIQAFVLYLVPTLVCWWVARGRLAKTPTVETAS